MYGASRASFDAVVEHVDPVLSAAGSDATLIAEHLFDVVDVLDSSGRLRRALTDPARSGEHKDDLVSDLFTGRDQRVLDIVAALASARWSEATDLSDGIEDMAVEALLAGAESAGELDALEEELFLIERTMVAERDVLIALDNRSATDDARRNLATAIFGGKVSDTAYRLLERAAVSPRGRRVSVALAEFVQAAAARRQRAVAHVTAAVDLTAEQRTRLAGILTKAYGRKIRLNVAVDPSVVGGIRVQVGHEVVDGTILSRLDDARRRLVG